MDRNQKARAAWILAGVVFLFSTVVFPLRTEWLNPPERPEVFQAPDGTAQAWTGELLHDRLKVLSSGQRQFYGWSEVSVDFLFPLAYTLLFILLLGLTWEGPGKPGWKRLWQSLTFAFPMAGGLADVLENVVLFLASTDRVWATGSAAGIEAALSTPASLLSYAGPWKFRLLGLSLLLLLVAVLASGRLGRFFTLIWLGRVPVLSLLVLVLLAALGGADQLSPTIPNMMLLTGFGQMALVALLAGVAAISAGFAMILVWEHGDERSGSELPSLPGWILRYPAGSARRGGPFLVFALPLVTLAMARSHWSGGVAFWKLLLGAAVGLGASFLAIRLVDRMRALVLVRLGASRLERLGHQLLRLVGPRGYLDENGNLFPGHLLSTVGVFLGALVYTACHFALEPSILRAGAAIVPTLAYVLGLVASVATILSGLTFLFDRWRMPLVLVLVLWATVFGTFFPVEHQFEAQRSSVALPTVGEAAVARLERLPADQRKILTVVTATGGGIQAAAWTARVMAGLDEELEGRFTPSVALLSSTSGGSVGGYFVLSGFDASGRLNPSRYSRVVAASEASSLEETAWGLLFPDLQRSFLPWVSAVKDRGWAMERGWMRARHQELETSREELLGERLSHWAGKAAAGELPAVVFNSTRIDDGGPLRLATVRSACDDGGPCRGPEGLSRAQGYALGPSSVSFLDLSTATAARLSATFPYVSPITQPVAKGLEGVPRWHAADGGYFDNHGTTGALAWFADLMRECGDCLQNVDKVVWLQIDTFPKTPALDLPDGGGWELSVAGPVLGLVRVRTGSQRFRRDQQVAYLAEAFADRQPQIEVVTVAPPNPDPDVVVRDPPLSWFLSPRDRARIERDWQVVASGQELERLRAWFEPKEVGLSPASASAADGGR